MIVSSIWIAFYNLRAIIVGFLHIYLQAKLSNKSDSYRDWD